MKQQTPITKKLTILTAALVCGLIAAAPDADVWNGTWKYNPKHSELPGPTAPIIVISYGTDGFLTITFAPVLFKGKLDGSSCSIIETFPVKHPERASCTMKLTESGAIEMTQSYDGKLMETDISTLAADGKSFVDVATPGPGQKGKLVKATYERQ
jgi:hypothetical protein